MDNADANSSLLYGAYIGSLKIVREALEQGADIECAEAGTVLTALHLAVGRSFVDVAKYLIEEAGATIKPDGHGRWPTVIAAQCCATEEMCDFIAAREAASASGASGGTEGR
ncbi:MAG: ankyrin repeat domain-containing protein [Hyphomicrobiales bacterium]|nr:ankyrin repeat domain-containing protein [Hyphomicrobiales bacterium]